MQPTPNSRIMRLGKKLNLKLKALYPGNNSARLIEDRRDCRYGETVAFWEEVKREWRESDAARVAEIERARLGGYEAAKTEIAISRLKDAQHAFGLHVPPGYTLEQVTALTAQQTGGIT